MTKSLIPVKSIFLEEDAINLLGDNEVLKFKKNNINLIEIDKAA